MGSGSRWRSIDVDDDGCWRSPTSVVTSRRAASPSSFGSAMSGSFATERPFGSGLFFVGAGPQSRGPVGARRSRRLLKLRDTARAMSQENVESSDAESKALKPSGHCLTSTLWDLRAYPVLDLDGVYVGRDAVIKASRHYWGTWHEYRLDAEQFIDAGSSVVIAVRERGRGRGSGAPFDQRWAQVWTFSRGRIIRWELFRHSTRPRSRGSVGARRSRRLLTLRDTARAMSQENVELVRRTIDAFNVGDLRRLRSRRWPGSPTWSCPGSSRGRDPRRIATMPGSKLRQRRGARRHCRGLESARANGR